MKYSNERKINIAFFGLVAIAIAISACNKDTVAQAPLPTENSTSDDGTVKVTRSKEECAAAARPDVAEEYNNYCVQCLPEHVDEEAAIQTFVIPVTPVSQTTPSEINRMAAVGVALNGITFDPPAPTEAILSAHTLAPFDDCGGHINPHGGYHYHAHTGCSTEVEQSDNHAPAIGYALDSFSIYANTDNCAMPPQREIVYLHLQMTQQIR